MVQDTKKIAIFGLVLMVLYLLVAPIGAQMGLVLRAAWPVLLLLVCGMAFAVVSAVTQE